MKGRVGGLFIVVVLLASCGSRQAESKSAARAGVLTATTVALNDSSSPSWLAVGRDIVDAQQKSGITAKHPPVLSEPVDVIAPGVYTFVAGPVDSAAVVDTAGVVLPPDIGFKYHQENPAQLEKRPSGAYVVVKLVIDTVDKPYSGLRVWLVG